MQRGRRVAQIRAAILTSDREGGADEAGSGSQTRGRQCGHSLAGGICPRGVLRQSVPAIGSAEGAACSTLLTGVAHQVHSLEGLYGPYEQGRGTSAGFNNNVQAVVHPVHKVHVGVSGRPEHDSVAARPSEARVGGLVVLTSIRFEFYDPANSYARSVVSDQSGAEKRVCSRQAISGQQLTRVGVLEQVGRHEAGPGGSGEERDQIARQQPREPVHDHRHHGVEDRASDVRLVDQQVVDPSQLVDLIWEMRRHRVRA